MRLRTRVTEQLIARLNTYMPLPHPAEWGTDNVMCVVEQLSMARGDGVEDDWQQEAELHGVLRVELVAAGADQLVAEPLLADLLANALLIVPDQSAQVGELSEQARAVFTDWRDVVSPSGLVPELRFQVDGSVVRRVAAAQPILEVYAGQAPDIGAAHVPDYQRVS